MVRFFADGGLDTYQTPMKCATQGLAAGVIKPFSKSIAIAGLVDAQVRDEVKALQKTVEEQVEPPFWSGGALSFLALTSGALLSCSEFLWIAHRLGERYGFSDRPPLAETLGNHQATGHPHISAGDSPAIDAHGKTISSRPCRYHCHRTRCRCAFTPATSRPARGATAPFDCHALP